MKTSTEQLLKRCRALLFGLGWKRPLFLIPSQKVYLRVASLVPTAAVDVSACMYLNPQFCDQLPNEELTFVLAHELMHLLMFHFGRRGNRKVQRWNRSTDRVINRYLKTLGLIAPSSALLPLDSAYDEYSAEEMYEVEPEQENDGQWLSLDQLPGATSGCGTLPAQSDGDDAPGDGETPEEGTFPTIEEVGRQWRQIAAQAIQQARSAGDQSGSSLAELLRVPPSRVKWAQILRGACARAIAERGRDDVSWTRRNRRSFAGDFILPGNVTYRAQVAVAVDTSGSVSDESLAQAVSEIEAISTTTRVAMYLVTHDAEVQHEGWIRPGMRRTAIVATMRGRGGTLFTPAYEAIEKAAKRFDHAVHLTDGMPCEPWPDRPRNCRKLVVALLGCKSFADLPSYATVVEAEI